MSTRPHMNLSIWGQIEAEFLIGERLFSEGDRSVELGGLPLPARSRARLRQALERILRTCRFIPLSSPSGLVRVYWSKRAAGARACPRRACPPAAEVASSGHSP